MAEGFGLFLRVHSCRSVGRTMLSWSSRRSARRENFASCPPLVQAKIALPIRSAILPPSHPIPPTHPPARPCLPQYARYPIVREIGLQRLPSAFGVVCFAAIGRIVLLAFYIDVQFDGHADKFRLRTLQAAKVGLTVSQPVPQPLLSTAIISLEQLSSACGHRLNRYTSYRASKIP